MARLENSEIAALFAEMADLLQIDGGDRHRVAAFRRAARIIEGLPLPTEQLLERGELGSVHGIGEGTIHRVKQMLRRHSCDDLDALRRRVAPGLREMVKIKGVGPTTVRNIHNRLGIETIDQLEYAARSGAIEAIPRMGTAMAHKILAGIEAYRRRQGKVPLIEAVRVGRRIVEALRSMPEVERIELAGSVRRGKAAIGDLDVLVGSRHPGPVVARFQQLPDVEEVLLNGESRCSVRLHNQQQADLRLLPPENFGAGLHYFTGSKQHNVELRLRAGRAGLKVSDKGVFTRDEVLIDPCREEIDVFRRMGLPWIPPELRENQGEFEAAERGRLPKLVSAGDLLGDLHMHTVDSDGTNTLREMAERARELGHRYLAITDHSKALRLANGLDERRVLEQQARIRRLEQEFAPLRILAGIEVDILADGGLDLELGVLAQLDWVIASVHQWTEQDEATMTKRVVAAVRSGVVDCIGHPTGRRPGKRDPYALNLDAVLDAARELGVAMECNGGPNRMDLGDVECRRTRERGVMVALDTDAHAARHLGRSEYALAMARRGWLEAKDVLNAMDWEEIAARRARRLRDHGGWGAVSVAVPGKGELGEDDSDDSVDGDGRAAAQAHAWGDVEPLELAVAVPVAVADLAAEGALARESLEQEERAALRSAWDGDVLDPGLHQRICDWLMAGARDPALEQALAELDGSGNALAVGFTLLSRVR